MESFSGWSESDLKNRFLKYEKKIKNLGPKSRFESKN